MPPAEREAYEQWITEWRQNVGLERRWYFPQILLLTPLGDAVVRLYRRELENPGEHISWNMGKLRTEIIRRCPRRLSD
jgi:hypothetical protein